MGRNNVFLLVRLRSNRAWPVGFAQIFKIKKLNYMQNKFMINAENTALIFIVKQPMLCLFNSRKALVFAQSYAPALFAERAKKKSAGASIGHYVSVTRNP